VACPGETDIAVLVDGYARTAKDLLRGEPGRLTPLQRARTVAEDLMGTYLADVGKARWCDKSLSNVFHLDQLASTWPEARFILLHRHCMDFVMNGIEVSPWGLAEYGFAQVAQMSPTDSVIALAAYWVDRTTRMLAFEERFSERCLRLRYEDLVTRTDEVMDGVWQFIGVPPLEGVATTAFEMDHSTYGPADHEIWYTRGVHSESIGRGARVPPDHVTGALRTGVNDLLERLDYSRVSDAWGSGVAAPVEVAAPRQDAPRAELSAFVELRVLKGHEVLWRRVVDLASFPWTGESADTALVADQPEGADLVVAIERDALGEICNATETIGTALRARTVRYYGVLPRYFKDELAVFERLAAFLVTMKAELLDPNGPLGSAR
jgi:hypothetical protein